MYSKKLIASLAAVGALGVGGVATAATHTPATSTPPKTAHVVKAPTGGEQSGGVDHDTLQQGDQTTPDHAEPAGQEKADENASSTQLKAGKNDPSEPGSNSEQAGNDGPGGHADEPGNPNANHQFQGVE